MKQRIKTIITDATDMGGKSTPPAEAHDKRVNDFLDSLGKHEVISIQCSTLAPMFNDAAEMGPALVTTIIYRK